MSEDMQKTENAAPAAEAGAKPEAAEKQKPEIKIIAPQAKNSLESVERDLMTQLSNKDKFPAFGVGDTVRVSVKIVEGDKQRIQPFEGVVLAKKHGGPRESFTVRRISYGVAIERVFPFHSPFIDSVEVVRKGKVRRAKLYYMRGRFGKSAVITEKVG